MLRHRDEHPDERFWGNVLYINHAGELGSSGTSNRMSGAAPYQTSIFHFNVSLPSFGLSKLCGTTCLPRGLTVATLFYEAVPLLRP